jgi:hypothetical protein
MSDASQGPGWWQATDGKWYAPETHPNYQPPPPLPPPLPPPPQVVAPPGMPATQGESVPPGGPTPAKSKTGRNVAIAAGVIVLVIIIVAVAAGSKKSTTTTATTSGGAPATAPPTTAPPTTATVPGVGATLTTSDGATVQLLSYGPDSGAANGFITPKAGNSLVSINTQGCASKTGSTTSFNPLYFTLKMKDNTVADAALGEIDGQIDSSDQAPGTCIRGKVGFEVPPGEVPATVIFSTIGGDSILQWSIG